MITPCPCCGSMNSLDSLIEHAAAREVCVKIADLNTDIGKAVIIYLGLFRPSKTKKLAFSRMDTLLRELLPDIQSGEITRNGNVYPAPVEAWIWGIHQVLAARDTLKLPLKGHGYLYEVLSRYERQAAVIDPVVRLKPELQSKTFSGMDELGELAGWIPDNL